MAQKIGVDQIQDQIWEEYQNSDIGSFEHSADRLDFVTSYLTRNKKTLNIGIGNGYLEKKLFNLNFEVSSLDPSTDAIARLNNTLGCDIGKVGYSQEIPWPDNTFEQIIMSEVLEHLSDEITFATIKELYRVLKPGGQVFVTVPAYEHLADSTFYCPCCRHYMHKWGHVRSFHSGADLLNLFGGKFQLITLKNKFFGSWGKLNWKGKIFWLFEKGLHSLGLYKRGTNWFLIIEKK